ncbi:PPOX class F420-dependent oxidoreductase [Micromonosporaceae bacterium Da 78-11]
MTFTEIELGYLAGQMLGRLATKRPDGTLQNSPVGYRWNEATSTIDIGGFTMAASRKFRNVADNGEVAFVVDDVPSVRPWRVRCLEVRGWAEALEAPADSGDGSAEPIIRIHPHRILSFGLEQADVEAHDLTLNSRDVS